MPKDAQRSRMGIAENKQRLRQTLAEDYSVEPDVLDRMEVMFDLTRLAARLARDFERIHRARGWTYPGFRIVNQLSMLGALEPNDLARLLGASRASISSALNTLEAGGYIERRVKAEDRRLIEVSLTDRGRHTLALAITDQAKREAAWVDVLTPAQRNTFARLVARLAEQPDFD